MPSHHAHHPRPWHAGSTFDAGPRQPLTREQRARCRYLLEAHRRAGRISLAHREVGMVLLRRLSVEGRCDPGHITLAHDAGVSPRTVQRALAALKNIGLIQWENRIERIGWQVRQVSNAYRWNAAAPLPRRLPSRRPFNPLARQPSHETVSHRETLFFLIETGSLEALKKARIAMEEKLASSFAARATR